MSLLLCICIALPVLFCPHVGGKWIAFGDDAVGACSTTGTDWIPSQRPNFLPGTSVRGVHYGADKFIAVGDSGQAAWSADCLRWVLIADIQFGTNTVYAVTYAWDLSRFVAVGEAGKASYSTDGLTWTATNHTGYGPDSTWYAIVYGGGRFVMVGWLSRLAYSDDGIDWVAAKPPVTYISGVAWGRGTFLAVASGTCTSTSTDAVSWTPHTCAIGVWYGAAYGPLGFVTVGLGTGGRVTLSPKNINKVDLKTGSLNLTAVAYSARDDLFVAVGTNGTGSYSKDGGVSWTAIVVTPSGTDLRAVCSDAAPPTVTPSPTASRTASASFSPSWTSSASASQNGTFSATPSPSRSGSATPSRSATQPVSHSITATASATQPVSHSITATASATQPASASRTATATATRPFTTSRSTTPSTSISPSASPASTNSSSVTQTVTVTESDTATSIATPTRSPTSTFTPLATTSQSASSTLSPAPTLTVSPTTTRRPPPAPFLKTFIDAVTDPDNTKTVLFTSLGAAVLPPLVATTMLASQSCASAGSMALDPAGESIEAAVAKSQDAFAQLLSFVVFYLVVMSIVGFLCGIAKLITRCSRDNSSGKEPVPVRQEGATSPTDDLDESAQCVLLSDPPPKPSRAATIYVSTFGSFSWIWLQFHAVFSMVLMERVCSMVCFGAAHYPWYAIAFGGFIFFISGPFNFMLASAAALGMSYGALFVPFVPQSVLGSSPWYRLGFCPSGHWMDLPLQNVDHRSRMFNFLVRFPCQRYGILFHDLQPRKSAIFFPILTVLERTLVAVMFGSECFGCCVQFSVAASSFVFVAFYILLLRPSTSRLDNFFGIYYRMVLVVASFLLVGLNCAGADFNDIMVLVLVAFGIGLDTLFRFCMFVSALRQKYIVRQYMKYSNVPKNFNFMHVAKILKVAPYFLYLYLYNHQKKYAAIASPNCAVSVSLTGGALTEDSWPCDLDDLQLASIARLERQINPIYHGIFGEMQAFVWPTGRGKDICSKIDGHVDVVSRPAPSLPPKINVAKSRNMRAHHLQFDDWGLFSLTEPSQVDTGTDVTTLAPVRPPAPVANKFVPDSPHGPTGIKRKW